MVKKYVFVRMPEEIYVKYVDVKHKMENDIKKVSGKNLTLTMPKVFNAIISPEFNENFIQVDLKRLHDLARKKKGKYGL